MAKNKALPFTIPKVSRAAIIAQEDREQAFFGKLHKHTEVQLSYIYKGSGILFAGNSIIPFKANSVIVLGSNVPHLFESNPAAYKESLRISIFIDADWFLQLAQNNPELRSLAYLVERSSTGFAINNPTSSIATLFTTIFKAKPVARFTSFITLVYTLKKLEFTALDSEAKAKPYSELDETRMRKLLDYTLSNYANSITINNAAALTALTPSSFCKYFKKRTGKTYIAFLNQVRIEASCRTLLEQPDLSIAEIAYGCGFSSLSNFNRQFKAIKSTTPKAYRSFINR